MSLDAFTAGPARRPAATGIRNWYEHEVWHRAGVSAPASGPVTAMQPGVAATAAEERRTSAGPKRLRRRREIGRSLFSTFDMARRRCGRGQAIRLGGL